MYNPLSIKRIIMKDNRISFRPNTSYKENKFDSRGPIMSDFRKRI